MKINHQKFSDTCVNIVSLESDLNIDMNLVRAIEQC
jgi:hypothetical protein